MINPAMMVFIFILSLIFHEFGHWFFFLWNKKKLVRIHYSEGEIWIGDWDIDYINLSLSERKRLLWHGVIIGIIPIYIAMISNIQYAWIFGLYLIGCKNDFIKLRKLYRE